MESERYINMECCICRRPDSHTRFYAPFDGEPAAHEHEHNDDPKSNCRGFIDSYRCPNAARDLDTATASDGGVRADRDLGQYGPA